MVCMDATNFGGGKIFFKNMKEQVMICGAVGLDKVNKGKSSNGGGDAATGGPPSVVTTGAGDAPDNSPEP